MRRGRIGISLGVAGFVASLLIGGFAGRPAGAGTATIGLPDRTCNHGAPLLLGQVASSTSKLFRDPVLLTLLHGVLLVGLGAETPASSKAIIVALTRNCTMDRSFGDKGVLRVTGMTGLSDMMATRDGKILLVGSGPESWELIRLLSNGTPDRTFGVDGRVSIRTPNAHLSTSPSIHPAARSAAEESTGTIVVAGTDGNPIADVRTAVTALRSTGRMKRGFGTRGWANPYSPGVPGADLLLERNGDILVHANVISTGCGGPILTLLTPEGVRAPFARNSGTGSLELFGGNAGFFGDVYMRPGGTFGAVGNDTAPCTGGSTPSEHLGLDEVFLPDGVADAKFGTNGRTQFLNDGTFDNWAVSTTAGGVVFVTEQSPISGVAQNPSGQPGFLHARLLASDGATDPRFGVTGVLTLDSSEFFTAGNTYPGVNVVRGPARTFVVCVTSPQGIRIARFTM